jgi:large exoprotein involved in heme utilization and adhesion
VTLVADSVLLTRGAQLNSFTRGQGKAGDVTIRATGAVIFDGLDENGNPSGANSTIEAGAVGDGGNITITAGSLSLLNGALVNASTFGTGNAGDARIRASGAIAFNGVEGGNITGVLSEVGRSGVGEAGDVEIVGRSLYLNRGSISTETALGQGGNIQVTTQELLLMRNQSQISTSAGTSQAQGNGGNIRINTPFIVSAPFENNDITANAFTGSGGRITINAQNLFWMTPRSRAELERALGMTDPQKLLPSELQTNDITAISQTDPTLNGQVSVTELGTDLSRGVVELPSVLNDASNRIAQNCSPKVQATNSLTSIGRSGIPTKPGDLSNNDSEIAPWVTNQNSAQTANSPQPTIVEAQTMRRDRNGDILLSAGATPTVPVHCINH